MININYRDPRPIYEQIKDGLKRLILTGIYKKDDKIVSVRDLATQLSINPNTIQRAYRELESEGYIYSVTGRGSFAAGKTDIDEKKKSELFKKIDDSVGELLISGISKEEILEYLMNKFSGENFNN